MSSSLGGSHSICAGGNKHLRPLGVDPLAFLFSEEEHSPAGPQQMPFSRDREVAGIMVDDAPGVIRHLRQAGGKTRQ